MTEHYVTLFDSLFLPQGLALHRSLERQAGDFHLWVITMDTSATEALIGLDLPHLTIVPLEEIETDELLNAKAGRSVAEYCWTVTPFSPDVVFSRDSSSQRATYVDADMWLVRDPRPIFEDLEAADAHALITPHAYSSRYETNLKYGVYCVQFMPFTRDGSRPIRQRWQEQCIDWCFATPDQGRFGDQKYLDAWPIQFGDDVQILSNPEWTQAPWNASRFASSDAITYHFHRLRLRSPHRADLGLYAIPRSHIHNIYRPYLHDVRAVLDELAARGVAFKPQDQHRSPVAALRHIAEFRLHNARDPWARQSLKF